MKLALNFCFFIFALVISGDESFSLTNYQIKNICKKEKRELLCIKDLQKKRDKLQNGKFIEVPVIPYK
tara:strand:- start:369 stop:572 length:204 start_codon:yes stop_codon:yes gene_type:complete